MKDKLYSWWKQQPASVRKSAVFVLGLLLIVMAPLVGWIPGPGGIIIFLLGIAILASEFEWALSLKSFFLGTLPDEIKRHWHPTPKWELACDLTALLMFMVATWFAYKDWFAPVLSLGIAGFFLFLFNRDRLPRLRRRLHK